MAGESFVEWIAAVQAGTTVILVLVTLHYAWSTHRMVEEARRQRVAAFRPVLIANINNEKWTLADPKIKFDLIVTNAGAGPALDIKLKAAGPPILTTPFPALFALAGRLPSPLLSARP